MTTDSERLRILADAIEHYGMPYGLEEFPTGPSVELLRRAANHVLDYDDREQMMRAYAAALDEVFALRRALAYESRVITAQTLDVKALGKGRREQVEKSVERMAQAAQGNVARGYAGTSRRSFELAMDEVGGSNFLTRASWEQEVFGDPDG